MLSKFNHHQVLKVQSTGRAAGVQVTTQNGIVGAAKVIKRFIFN